MKAIYTLTIFLFIIHNCLAQEQKTTVLKGKIVDQQQEALVFVNILLKNKADSTLNYATTTNEKGQYQFTDIPAGTYDFIYSYLGQKKQIELTYPLTESSFDLIFEQKSQQLATVEVVDESRKNADFTKLRDVEGTTINAGRKSEVVHLEAIAANLAINNSRQIYAKIAGLNIWESDGMGLQLGIGGRGLSPNRTSNFNTRQDGYDISADALGYPESYYTPPSEAVDRIEVVRGAASLQYGTQFGGLLNFKLKKGAKNKPFEFAIRNTIGSFGLKSTFNSIGGTVAKGKINYYGFYQYKTSDGWRNNADSDAHTAYASINYSPNEKMSLSASYTHLHYLAQQSGGLTNTEFQENPQQSNRERNWFKIDWNVFSLSLDYQLSSRTKINIRNFGLLASRESLGYLGGPDNTDPIYLDRASEEEKQRSLICGFFHNIGSESRLLHRYDLFQQPATLLIGARYYQGQTISKQGSGSSNFDPDFTYLNADQLDGSDYEFPSRNIAFFAENLINITPQISITPGIRYEYIRNTGEGYYRQIVRDLADNVVLDTLRSEGFFRERSLALLGLGVSYKPNKMMEVYSNFSQNYRAINFNDFKIINPTLVIDQNLQDESGYNADLGVRGRVKDWLHYDVSLFYLAYNDRIGEGWLPDNPSSTVRYRTNIADSHIYGLESFVELDVWNLFDKQNETTALKLFSNIAILNSANIRSDISFYEGKKVELVPPVNLKTGITFRKNALTASAQFSYTHQHFSDPTNAEAAPSAIIGIIPSYYVADISVNYRYKFLELSGGINNLTNNYYFTRRATGYPGPGILPSDGRSFYLTLGMKL